MRVSISGTRDGVEWPQRGDVLVTTDAEAAELVAQGYAERVVAEPAPVEAAVVVTAPKKRTLTKKSTGLG
jgi:hypothetical protein